MKKNTDKITKEFCKDKILIFAPQTTREAEFIQRKIFEMGYDWWSRKDNHVQYLEESVLWGMVLSDGELTWQVSRETPEIALLCTADQLDENWAVADLSERVKELPNSKLQELFMELQQKFPREFTAVANPAALTRDIEATSPPVAKKKPPSPE